MRDISVNLLEEVEANTLSSLPHILIKLLDACSDEDVSFDSICDIISKDAALCAKVVAIANSPVYGHARELTSLKHILMFLGLETIKSIVITAAVKQFFSKYSNSKSQFLKSLWVHSLNCAIIAKSLASLTRYEYTEEAYVAGLLHDVGKLVLENRACFDYTTLTHNRAPNNQLLATEQQRFNTSHDVLGANLLERWNISPAICDSVRYHHTDIQDIQVAHHLVKIIYLANILASNMATENSTLCFETALTLFDLSESVVYKIQENATQEVMTVAGTMDIELSPAAAKGSLRDEKKQIELAQRVRDIALTQGSKLPFVHNDQCSIYESIQKCLMLLFGVHNSLVFINDNQQQLVLAEPQALAEKDALKTLTIPLESSSLLSQSVEQKNILNSFTAGLNVVDQQLAGALNSPGIICIPAYSAGQLTAVIILGVSSHKASELFNNQDLLNIFSLDIAERILDSRHKHTSADTGSTENLAYIKAKAREVIHETSNPLSVIRNYLHILGQRLDEKDPVQEDLQLIKEEIDRVGNIILRCADDGNQEHGNFDIKQTDINILIEKSLKIFKYSLFATHKITAKVGLDDSIEMINIDHQALKHVINNLIKNAVEAMAEHGELSISTGNININGKAFIEIIIADNGPGIEQQIFDNIYTPVESTKGSSHAGLGLSIVKNLIDNMHGSISCKTNSQGTRFTIQLPKKNKND